MMRLCCNLVSRRHNLCFYPCNVSHSASSFQNSPRVSSLRVSPLRVSSRPYHHHREFAHRNRKRVQYELFLKSLSSLSLCLLVETVSIGGTEIVNVFLFQTLSQNDVVHSQMTLLRPLGSDGRVILAELVDVS